MPLNCPVCGKFLAKEYADFGATDWDGETAIYLVCPDDNCWQNDHPIPAPEYNWLYWGLDDDQLAEVETEAPECAAALRQERDAYYAMLRERGELRSPDAPGRSRTYPRLAHRQPAAPELRFRVRSAQDEVPAMADMARRYNAVATVEDGLIVLRGQGRGQRAWHKLLVEHIVRRAATFGWQVVEG